MVFIVSSPLILGFDLTNTTVLNDVMPYVGNEEAIAVNQIWAGDPGRLLPLSTAESGLGYEVWYVEEELRVNPSYYIPTTSTMVYTYVHPLYTIYIPLVPNTSLNTPLNTLYTP